MAYISHVQAGLLNAFGRSTLKNVIINKDGTLSPMKNHNNCTGVWEYDGQVFKHQCRQLPKGLRPRYE